MNGVAAKLRSDARLIWEFLFDIGKRQYFSQFGEDAFLQAYFVRKSWLELSNKSQRFSAARQLPQGFYVDVGAHAPKLFSNTYWFYKRGWRGINIDAAPGAMRAFNLIRPRDINVQTVVSDRLEEVAFYSWGLSSPLNTAVPEQVNERSKLYGRSPEKLLLPARPLADILAEHLPSGQHIDFLSVDVEGYEEMVLQSNNWHHYRPELVLVEQYQDTIEDVLSSAVAKFMDGNDYAIYAWPMPNVCYVDRRGLSS